MQLKTLLSATPVRQVFGSVDRPVENIAYDSRRVQRHTMFVALRGEKTDGHQFIGQAIDKGASVIVAERELLERHLGCVIGVSPVSLLKTLVLRSPIFQRLFTGTRHAS